MSGFFDVQQNLITFVSLRDEVNILHNLKIFPKNTELDNVELIKDLLKFINTNILKLTTELIAELAKNEFNRKICTNEEVIKDLLNLLESEDFDIVIHSIRALGNICYENEEACKIVEKMGTNKLLSILKDDYKREDNALTTKTSGLLLNLFNMNNDAIKSSLKDGILPILQDLLLKYSQQYNENEQLLTFLVCIINNLENFLPEHNIPFTEDLCRILIDIFRQSKSAEISIPCLEIFHGQCEPTEIKKLLANGNVCELIFELIEKYRDQANDADCRSVLKMACDFIVVILTEDVCMELLYNFGQGKVYKNILDWLDSDDPDLLSTSILALGNFARKDSHCIEMVESGISSKLISILHDYNRSTKLEDVKIQHALLSTMKNLVIPPENKAKIAAEGLVAATYPMINNNHDLVIFKLLGTYRMVVDRQEDTAMDLISRRDFIDRLVYWCYNSDHLGVRGEVPRLLVWMIKNCSSFGPIDMLLDVPESIKCIVEMTTSNHVLMQRESLNTLNRLYVGCKELDDGVANVYYRVLISADVGNVLELFLSKYAEKMDRQTLEIFVKLLDRLCNSPDLLQHLKYSDIIKPLVKLYDNPQVSMVPTIRKIENILSAKK